VIELLIQAEGALSVGLLDRAETLYRQVARADPRNSIAVVGLARVMLERSDEVGALTLARRALTIDPENNAAQRMVQRLEEVLRHRGVALAPAAVALAPAATAVAPATVALAPALAPAAESEPAATEPRHEHRSYLDRLLRRR
jgi:cell division septation protein DedD